MYTLFSNLNFTLKNLLVGGTEDTSIQQKKWNGMGQVSKSTLQDRVTELTFLGFFSICLSQSSKFLVKQPKGS